MKSEDELIVRLKWALKANMDFARLNGEAQDRILAEIKGLVGHKLNKEKRLYLKRSE